MSKCNKCKIEINGNISHCPLCNNKLKGSITENVFPIIKINESKLLSKILLLVSLAIAIIGTFLEYYISKKIFISKYIIFGLITNYILIILILKNYKNILKMLNKYFLIMFFLFIVWYFITKSLIITTYFIPIICIIIYVFNSIVMLVYRDSYIIKYTRTILLDVLIGLIPLLLIYLKITSSNLIPYISVLIDVIFFLGVLIFCKDNIFEEIERTFNI